MTFLVVPILVLEDLGVGDALKRSKDLFKKTWGENVIGQVGLGMRRVRRHAPRSRPDRRSASRSARSASCVLGAIGVAWLVASAVVVSALSGIYRTALYHFAANGEVPGSVLRHRLPRRVPTPSQPPGFWGGGR